VRERQDEDKEIKPTIGLVLVDEEMENLYD